MSGTAAEMKREPNRERLHWTDTAPRSVYADDVESLGSVIRSDARDNGWDAYDLTSLNAAQSAPLCIGHFKSKRKAKEVVEDYWRLIG